MNQNFQEIIAEKFSYILFCTKLKEQLQNYFKAFITKSEYLIFLFYL